MPTYSRKNFILIDANSWFYRAFYALPRLTLLDGRPCGAVYGVALMLLKIIEEFGPDYLAIALDSKEPTFRHQLFPDYKAQRPPMPQDLVSQIDLLFELIKAFQIASFRVPGFEADDIIATIVNKLSQKEKKGLSFEIIIASGDRDLLQLVRPGVVLFTTKKGFSSAVVFDENLVEDKYGVRPDQLIDYKVLVGDASDNIPGIKGIGPKTARELLLRYDSINNMVLHLDELSDRQKNLLSKAVNNLTKYRELIVLKTNVPIELRLSACRFHGLPILKLKKLFHRWGFNSLISRLEKLGSLQQNLFSTQ